MIWMDHDMELARKKIICVLHEMSKGRAEVASIGSNRVNKLFFCPSSLSASLPLSVCLPHFLPSFPFLFYLLLALLSSSSFCQLTVLPSFLLLCIYVCVSLLASWLGYVQHSLPLYVPSCCVLVLCYVLCLSFLCLICTGISLLLSTFTQCMNRNLEIGTEFSR